MFCALIGAITAMTLLVPLHDRSLARQGLAPQHSAVPRRAARSQ